MMSSLTSSLLNRMFDVKGEQSKQVFNYTSLTSSWPIAAIDSTLQKAFTILKPTDIKYIYPKQQYQVKCWFKGKKKELCCISVSIYQIQDDLNYLNFIRKEGSQEQFHEAFSKLIPEIKQLSSSQPPSSN